LLLALVLLHQETRLHLAHRRFLLLPVVLRELAETGAESC
jgi:hypothetical protein